MYLALAMYTSLSAPVFVYHDPSSVGIIISLELLAKNLSLLSFIITCRSQSERKVC